MRITGKPEGVWKSGYIQVFALGYFAAMLSFVVLLIRGDGIFTLGNDFNEQQIPFHMLANRAVKSGNTGWSWSVDLGSSLIGALGFPFCFPRNSTLTLQAGCIWPSMQPRQYAPTLI